MKVKFSSIFLQKSIKCRVKIMWHKINSNKQLNQPIQLESQNLHLFYTAKCLQQLLILLDSLLIGFIRTDSLYWLWYVLGVFFIDRVRYNFAKHHWLIIKRNATYKSPLCSLFYKYLTWENTKISSGVTTIIVEKYRREAGNAVHKHDTIKLNNKSGVASLLWRGSLSYINNPEILGIALS